MRRFKSPNIIRILDSAVVQEADHSSGFGNIPSSDADAGSAGKTVRIKGSGGRAITLCC